jgi:hypothetical protein
MSTGNCTYEGCIKPAFTKSGLCRGHNLAAARANRKPKPAASAKVVKDALDLKLDHFTGTKDDKTMEWWEGDQTLSPLHVPKEVKDNTAYADRRWHWSSDTKWSKYGKNYHGWQLFTDAAHPEGIRRGNDTFLTWMPEEKAARYNAFTSRQSTQRVRGLQENQLKRSAASDPEVMQGEAHLNIGERPVSGMMIKGKFVPTGPRGRRGYSAEEMHEMVTKAKEDRGKRRVYSYGG